MLCVRTNAPVTPNACGRSQRATRARSKAKAAGLLLLVAVVASACGRVEGVGELAPPVDKRTPPVEDAGVALDPCGPLDQVSGAPGDACDAFAQAHAVFTKACLGYDACRPSLAKSCRDLLALPGTSLTMTDVTECTAAVQSGTPACALPSCSQYGARLVSPIESKTGSLPSGSACLVDHQCVSGECHFDYGKTCGVCQKTRFIRQSCNPPSEPCLDGMNCIEGVCEDGGKNVGEACDASTACAWDLYCDAGPGGAGVCARRREYGEPCSKSVECLYRYCDVKAAECAAHPPVGTKCSWGDEAPCGFSNVMQCSGDVCEWIPVAEGGDCSEAPCSQGMKCVDGVCRKPAGTGLGQGERCYDTYCAAGLTCAYVPCDGDTTGCYDRICLSRQPGDACSETCSPGAFCNRIRCEKLGRRGDACLDDPSTCLEHLACVDGTCVGWEASLCR